MREFTYAKDWSVFSADAYLHEYYADIGAENLAILNFLVQSLRETPPQSVLLDFGGGPTIYSLIVGAKRAQEMHFCDYLESNLIQVRMWLEGSPDAFDWTEFIKTTLVLEGSDYSKRGILSRANEVRTRVTDVMRCDAALKQPVQTTASGYDVLISNFCAESATDDVATWRRSVENIVSLIKPGGRLVMSALKGASSYGVGKEIFPAVNIMESDLLDLLSETGFIHESIHINSVPADRPSRHYQGLMFVTAMKSA